MRVLHVIMTMDPAMGGPPAVVSRLAAAQATCLGAAGRVTVISHETVGRESEMANSLRGIPGIENVTFTTVPAKLKFGALLQPDARATLRQSVAEADVLHLHGIWDPLLFAAARQARRLGVPYVVMPHGMLDPWSLSQSKWKKRVALALGIRKMLARAACLHVLNADESRLIEPLRLPTPRRVIPNGLFLEEIEPRPAAGSFYAQHPELRNEPYILFLSRLHFKKGLDYLAAAFALLAPRLPNVRLVVAGPDGGERASFEQHVRQSGLTERTHVVGPLYGPTKLTALVDATCFCLPSRQEGFSVAITEALGCGVPVVISENCHFPEVEAVGAGIVTPLEPPAIAGALVKVVSDAELRRRMGEAGRRLVEKELNWPAIAARTIEMYRAARR